MRLDRYQYDLNKKSAIKIIMTHKCSRSKKFATSWWVTLFCAGKVCILIKALCPRLAPDNFATINVCHLQIYEVRRNLWLTNIF